MTRSITPLYIPDLSVFAKTLRADLLAADAVPGHLTLLGMLAKAAGYQNYQHLIAAQPAPPPEPPKIDRALRVFDSAGRMKHWPSGTKLQGLCLWVFWSRLPPRAEMTERQVNEVLQNGNLFGDHVLLRRSLIDHRMVERTRDGRIYTRIEQAPPPEALALIRAVAASTDS
ncbi:MAG: DUF2087 domain-containing protein [Rhodobacteraceae bacterium]|nr:DUF2087 domain-containing protein [Paracoccaceae bacterium]